MMTRDYFRSLFLLLMTVALSFPSETAHARKKRQVPQLSTAEIITKVNDYWQQHRSPLVRSFWDEAAYHTGNMEAYRLLGQARWLDYSIKWANHNKWSGARGTDSSKWKYKTYGEGPEHVLFGDWQICFQTYLDIYEFQPDDYKIARAKEVMDYEVRQPQADFWWWADALYMVMPVMTKMYKTTGEMKYLDKLYENFRWSDELMFDKDEQLYYRDAKYIWPKVKTACNGGKSFWARGDGWVLAGLAKVLSDMPQDYKHRDFFVQRFRQLAEGVARVQRPGGYWSRSMLCEEDAPGPETSGTAFFTYGMLWGINNGLLERSVYEPVIDKAWQYLINTALQTDWSVGYVQPIGEKPDPTKTVNAHSQANFGTGAFLLAACEHLRYENLKTGNCSAVKVIVDNTANEYREQVIELPADTIYNRLSIQGGRAFIVYDVAGLEVPYQLSSDGKILVEAGVRPRGSQTFTIRCGTPKVYRTVCYGRVFPERKDDFAWENDRGAYRVYGPALQKAGDRSYGIDVWTKNTPELVLDQRYWIEDVVMMPIVEKLRRENRQRGDSLYRLNSYHHDHGRGSDLYQVGPTLGCGTPALMVDDELLYPYCFQNYRMLDMGPLRMSVQLDYGTTVVSGDSVTEHRIVTLDKGSNFCRMTVWYDGLSAPVRFSAGIVLHSNEQSDLVLGKDYLHYTDPTDNIPVNNCLLFTALLFPEGQVDTKILSQGTSSVRHAVGVLDHYKGEPYTYYFGSAWSKFDVRSQKEWEQRILWTMHNVREPLKVAIK